MPRSPQKDSKNERSLKRELARVAARLRNAEEKKDGYVNSFIHQLTEDRRKAQQAARRALELVVEHQNAQKAEQAARRALELTVERQNAQKAEQARARRTSVCQAAAVCMFTVLAPLLFRL